jgi:hypothetical protein
LSYSFLRETYADNVLVKAFITPFTDIGKVLHHGIKKTTTKGFGQLGLALTNVAAILLPFKSFMDILAKKKEKLAQEVKNVDQEFAKVLETSKVWQDPEFLGITFLLNPAAWIGANLALRSPGPAMNIVSTMIGGNETLDRWRAAFTQATAPRRIYAGAGTSPDPGNLGAGEVSYDDAAGAMGIDEQVAPSVQQQYSKALAQFLANPQIQAQINNSPIAQKLKMLPLKILIDEATSTLAFNSFQELQSKNASAANQLLQDLGLGQEELKNPEVMKKLDLATLELKKKLKSVFMSNLQGVKAINPNAAKEIDATGQQINKM